jgi:hypothetical protein
MYLVDTLSWSWSAKLKYLNIILFFRGDCMKFKDYFTTGEGLLRIGIFGSFLGHGVFALGVKQSWLPYFTSVGLTESFGTTVLPIYLM